MKNQGFTLVEIIVVVAILSVLMAITVPGVMNYFDDVDEYISSTDKADEIDAFTHELFKQIDWEKIERMTR